MPPTVAHVSIADMPKVVEAVCRLHGARVGKGKLTDRITVRFDEAQSAVLSELEHKHKVPAADCIRGLVAAMADFYQEHGWFSFPARIEPERFQSEIIDEAVKKYRATGGKSKLHRPRRK